MSYCRRLKKDICGTICSQHLRIITSASCAEQVIGLERRWKSNWKASGLMQYLGTDLFLADRRNTRGLLHSVNWYYKY